MNFKEYDETIKKHKYDMLSMIIYYNLQCNDDLIIDELTEENIQKFIQLIWSAYMCDEQHLDLAFICDKLVENAEKILDGNWTKWDLLEVCYE